MRPPAHATRTDVRPRIDGRLDEPQWQQAELLTDFLQSKPSEGSPASERTEVRILYDDKALYVAFRCLDPHASEMRPRLARRDNISLTDWVGLALDTFHDRRNAYVFVVTSAGTLIDGTQTEGVGDTRFEWDGVWEARTTRDAAGWYAEMEIPFSTLRFPREPVQRWGIFLRRLVARDAEQSDWSLVGTNESTFIGKFPDLVGIEGVSPGLSLQLAPYLSGGSRLSFAEDSLAPRDRFKLDAGMDFKYGVTGTLTLDATLNPDFGQVEVDPEVLNLSAYETFFPERRRFFLEGSELFGTVTPFWQWDMALVYTRRIGAPPAEPDPVNGGSILRLDPLTRIIGAAKLSGNVRPGTAISLLSARVGETTAIEEVDEPYARNRFRLVASPAATYSVARVRQLVSEHSTVGAVVTSVVRDGAAPNAHVFVADFDLRNNGNYTAAGYVGMSATSACNRAHNENFRDGDRCDRLGATLTAGKTGGRFQLFSSLEYTGAHFDINDLGYFPHLLGNQVVGQSVVGSWRLLQPQGPMQELWTELGYSTAWDPAAASPGYDLPLTRHVVYNNSGGRFTRGNWHFFMHLERQLSQFMDDAETRGNRNVRLYRREPRTGLTLVLHSDSARPLSFGLDTSVSSDGVGRLAASRLSSELQLWRFQLGLDAGVTVWRNIDRRIGDTTDEFPVVARLDLNQIDASAHLTATVTRELTGQLFAQVLHAAQRHTNESVLRGPETRVSCGVDPVCGDLGAPGSNDETLTTLILNAVMRWEFRPGSTFYLVYTHNHQVTEDGSHFALGTVPRILGSTVADNALALKLTYLWSL